MEASNTTKDHSDERTAARDVCPGCGVTGRKVDRVTLESLLRPTRRADIGPWAYRVCLTPDCETVYYAVDAPTIFRASDLGVRFGLKESAGPRTICYCYGHTLEDIQDEIRRTGTSTVVGRIKAEMKRSGCRCAQTNPLGGCCLKTVGDAVARAFRSNGDERRAVSAETADQEDCCASDVPSASDRTAAAQDCCATRAHSDAPDLQDGCRVQESPSGGPSERSRASVAAAGSVLAAVLSSACCWLPLVLMAFGASAAGVAGFFESYRPYFLTLAVVMLGLGFYTSYFRRDCCADRAACDAPTGRLKMFNRMMLWTAALLVGVFAFFPNYVGLLLSAPTPKDAPAPDARLASVELHIEGMTCEGCAARLRATLLNVSDVATVAVDYESKTAVVQYAADRPDAIDRVMSAATESGYRASRLHRP